MTHPDLDLIIVGGGPAGLCAAMYAGRGMLKAVLLERGIPGGELLNTEKVDDYPGFTTILGPDLALRMTEHAQAFGADIQQENVEGIYRLPDGTFRVATSSGAEFFAPVVILTAGGTPTKLEVPGEMEYAGRGVSYCAVCDGAFFKGETIAVVGGGDAAVEEADYLTRYAAKVYIIHRRDEFRASKLVQERALANPRIEVLWNTRVIDMMGEARGLTHLNLEDVEGRGRSRLDVTGCFVFIGFKPNSGLVMEHVEHDAAGYIVTDERMMTSIPGLFAAGDLRSQLTRQVTTAVGDATTAAIATEKYLTERRSRLASRR
ncbi:MAG TPA: thioredoxin-disulfide reductase [Gemmatimonadales bacterium]|nr:thioredoxin-disulfide reductase [Gemmatimonadales bacterium]